MTVLIDRFYKVIELDVGIFETVVSGEHNFQTYEEAVLFRGTLPPGNVSLIVEV